MGGRAGLVPVFVEDFLIKMIKDGESYLRACGIFVAAGDADGLAGFDPIAGVYEDRVISEHGVFAECAVVVFDLDKIILVGIGITGVLQAGVFPGVRHPAAAGCEYGIAGLYMEADGIPVLGRGLVAILL
jgi:hypothetical protein